MKLNEPVPMLASTTTRTLSPWLWFALGLLLVTLGGFGFRYGTTILQLPAVRDEPLMRVPIADILEQDWSKRTMLDYQEVKGPTFYWGYAAAAELLGGAMNDLRLVSVLCFVFGGMPLLLIAMRAGVRGPPLLIVAALYVLLPYNALVSQLLMSEPSFMLLALWLTWTFLWGFGETAEGEKRVAGPILFAIILSLLLHHRPHAVTFAGAAALVALERDGVRSWPWWAACIAAGLSRIPLWLYWGGLVTSHYQELFTFGLRVDCQTYLLAAVLPWTAVFIWAVLVRPELKRHWRWLVLGAGFGLIIGMTAHPDLAERAAYRLPGETVERDQSVYAGVISTALRLTMPTEGLRAIALTLLAGFGGASVAAFAVAAFRRPVIGTDGIVRRLAFWLIAAGVPLYIITSGPVYDRYLAIWMILMPVVWVLVLPRIALIAQSLLCAGMAAYLVGEWLF